MSFSLYVKRKVRRGEVIVLTQSCTAGKKAMEAGPSWPLPAIVLALNWQYPGQIRRCQGPPTVILSNQETCEHPSAYSWEVLGVCLRASLPIKESVLFGPHSLVQVFPTSHMASANYICLWLTLSCWSELIHQLGEIQDRCLLSNVNILFKTALEQNLLPYLK